MIFSSLISAKSEERDKKRERKRERQSVDRCRGGRAKETRRGAEWEDARLLEEGRNWGDDPPGERNPETSRARDLSSCEAAALFVHDVRVSALSFCAPLAPTPVSSLNPAQPPPLSTLSDPLLLPFRCVPSRYSFVLPRLPSSVVLADATGDSTPKRNVTRTMISGRIFFLPVRIDPLIQNVGIRNFIPHASRNFGKFRANFEIDH